MIIDLYSQSKFPQILYKFSDLPENTTIFRFLSSKEEIIDDKTKNEEIDAEVKEYVVVQNQLARYFSSLGCNILGKTSEFTSRCSEVSTETVNKLAAYGIECVPETPLSQEKRI